MAKRGRPKGSKNTKKKVETNLLDMPVKSATLYGVFIRGSGDDGELFNVRFQNSGRADWYAQMHDYDTHEYEIREV